MLRYVAAYALYASGLTMEMWEGGREILKENLCRFLERTCSFTSAIGLPYSDPSGEKLACQIREVNRDYVEFRGNRVRIG